MATGAFSARTLCVRRALACFALIGALTLSGCGTKTETRATDNTMVTDMNSTDTMTTNDTMTENKGAAIENDSATAAPPEDPWCEVANDSLPKAECDRLQSFVSHLKIGEAGLRSPDELYIGDTRTVTFAITTEQSPAAATEALGSPTDSKRTSTTVTSPVKVARRMAANLTGAGFDITPVGDQTRDLAITGQAFWAWQITAKDVNATALDLSVSVVMLDAQGKPSPHLVRVMHRDVRVKVHITIAWVIDQINQLSTLTKALIALVSTLGTLWLAVRTFGTGKGTGDRAAKTPDAPPPQPPAP